MNKLTTLYVSKAEFTEFKGSPATEANGRVHTSTVAVVVRSFGTESLPFGDEIYIPRIQVLPMPEESGSETSDDLFTMDEIKIEVMRARGAGGQVGTSLSFNVLILIAHISM